MDNLPNELVRRLRTLRLRIDVAHQEALHCGDFDDRTRIWPQPEIREVERLLEAADALLREILGD
jgi:hypothetical protein